MELIIFLTSYTAKPYLGHCHILYCPLGFFIILLYGITPDKLCQWEGQLSSHHLTRHCSKDALENYLIICGGVCLFVEGEEKIGRPR